MYCKCGQPVQSVDNFCPRCGTTLNPGSSVINGIGGNNYGNQIYAGGDVYYSTNNASSAEQATYDAIPKWRSPFTQSILAWIGTLTSIASLFPFWKFATPIISFLRSKTLQPPDTTINIFLFPAFAILLMIAIISFYLRRVAKYELRIPIIQGWALTGNDHRIGIDRIKCGNCPTCGGKLKYVNWPVSWDAEGKVAKKVPALVCCRNSKHWYEVDIAEKKDHA